MGNAAEILMSASAKKQLFYKALVQNPDFWVLGPNVQVKWSRQDVYFQSR